MNVLMVCSEFAPWAKTGGLGDAVAGLGGALAAAGHDVRVLLPHYAHLPPAPGPSAVVATPLGTQRIAELANAGGARVFTVDLGEPSGSPIYTGDVRDAGRFLRLAAAAAVFAPEGWRPHVVHCHDWHAALTPVVQRLTGSAVPSILTLHNVGYQGVFPIEVLDEHAAAGLPHAIAADARGAGTVNFLRAGLRSATRISTVSPTYATEILAPEFGMGLEDVLVARRADVVGILNGVDYGVWSPERDPFIAARYSAADLAPKRRNKQALLAQLGLDGGNGDPLVGLVTRLAGQKGIDLLVAALPTLLAETRACFAILGSGEAWLAAELRRFATEQPRRVAFVDGYDEALSHRIFAGSDITVVPSRYEPCGLTQMYALRYGTVPVVRATGGLADTIAHFDPATGAGNGSVFRDADVGGLLWGLRTALGWYDDERAFARAMANGMAADFSWRRQVPRYEDLYRSVSASRA
jgi:starch synthase